jgi:DHA2 family multidrug resistance protein
MIAYIDDFYLLMWGTIVSIPIILLMRPPRRPKPGDEEVHLAIE